MPGNLTTTLGGAFHLLKYRKVAEHYLATFAYRFNRRFDLRGLVTSLIVDVARCGPVKEASARAHAAAHFYLGNHICRALDPGRSRTLELRKSPLAGFVARFAKIGPTYSNWFDVTQERGSQK